MARSWENMLFSAIESSQVELPAQIPAPWHRTWALGGLCPCTRTTSGRPSFAVQRRRTPGVAEATPGSGNQAPGPTSRASIRGMAPGCHELIGQSFGK